jgi:hypothetical protein
VAGDENLLVLMNQIVTKRQHESNNYSKKKETKKLSKLGLIIYLSFL